jgi:hypothetical protein
MRSPDLDEARRLLSDPSQSAYLQPPFSTVSQLLAEIDGDGAQSLSTQALHEDVEWLASVAASAQAMIAQRVAEIDRREHQGPPDPHQSCTQWLQDTLRLTPNAAHAQVRSARQLEQLPPTARAFRRGELSAQHVDVICRAMEQVQKTRLDPSDVEATLIDAARRMDPRELLRHWFQLRYQGDQAAGVEAEREQHERRWLRLTETWAGDYRIEGRLDSVGGATLKTAIQGLLGPRRKDDERAPEQRVADAVVELARSRLDAGDLPRQGGERPHLTLIAELSTLRLEPGSPLAQLDWGPLVTGETARRIACDASVTPVLEDSNRDILHVGRRSRTLRTPLRRALHLRDRHCKGPGCTMPALQCEPHHRVHWIDGGPDELANLTLYCRFHHGQLHPENARYRQNGGRTGAVQNRAP